MVYFLHVSAVATIAVARADPVRDRRRSAFVDALHSAERRAQIPANQFSPCLLQKVSRNVLVTSIAMTHLAFL